MIKIFIFLFVFVNLTEAFVEPQLISDINLHIPDSIITEKDSLLQCTLLIDTCGLVDSIIDFKNINNMELFYYIKPAILGMKFTPAIDNEKIPVIFTIEINLRQFIVLDSTKKQKNNINDSVSNRSKQLIYTITVYGDKPRVDYNFNKREVVLSAGFDNDPLKIMNVYPFVTQNRGITQKFGNFIIINGGDQYSNGYMLDENYIDNILLLAGGKSYINPLAAKSVNLFVYNPEIYYDNIVLGVIDYKIKDANLKKIFINSEFTPVASNVVFGIPISKNIGALFAVRKSCLQRYLNNILNRVYENNYKKGIANYFDGNIKVTAQNNSNKYTIGFYSKISNFGYLDSNQSYELGDSIVGNIDRITRWKECILSLNNRYFTTFDVEKINDSIYLAKNKRVMVSNIKKQRLYFPYINIDKQNIKINLSGEFNVNYDKYNQYYASNINQKLINSSIRYSSTSYPFNLGINMHAIDLTRSFNLAVYNNNYNFSNVHSYKNLKEYWGGLFLLPYFDINNNLELKIGARGDYYSLLKNQIYFSLRPSVMYKINKYENIILDIGNYRKLD